jgi:hypothetical protein
MARGVAGDQSLMQAALEGLEAQRSRIEEQIQQVRAMLGQKKRGRPPAAASTGNESAGSKPERKKRVLSVAARKRIAAAQKKRWADFRKSDEGKQ